MSCPFNNPEEIQTIEHVRRLLFFWIKEECLIFHPDNPMEDYINFLTGKPLYSKELANQYNMLIERCVEVCEQSGNQCIYSLALDIVDKSI